MGGVTAKHLCRSYISHKADLGARKVTSDKKGHCLTIKLSFSKITLTALNVQMPKNQVAKYVKQKLIELQGQVDESTIIVRDFKNTLSVIKIHSKQKQSSHS